MTDAEELALEKRLRYNAMTRALLSNCAVELKAAKHFEAKSNVAAAIQFIDRLTIEAKKLRKHLKQWHKAKPPIIVRAGAGTLATDKGDTITTQPSKLIVTERFP